jgi:exopolyphosphatase/guanosine-5'-triphosphate,3'-diphosphate pyrophosphatase
MAGGKKNEKTKRAEKVRRQTFPLRVGCVDTGSNAIRFLVEEFTGPRESTTLAYERVPIRLGHQVFLTGQLAASGMDGAAEAFRSFKRQADEFHLDGFRAVATSAVRESKNGHELVGRIFEETGIVLEMISGSEEARLVHLAVASRVALTGGKWILTDLGGGSVEVSLVDDMGMLWSESHTMGSVRLLEKLSEAEPTPAGFRDLLSKYVSTLRIPPATQYWSQAGFVATGGNIEALAELAGAPTDEEDVATLPVKDLGSVIDLLAEHSYNARITKLGLREDRADVILPAAVVYERLAHLAGAREILVPGVGVKEGILVDLVDDIISHDTHEVRQEQALTKAAISLGRRFMFDEAHGIHVARLAVSLFDQLKTLHGLDESDRRLLLTGAILHDVGVFMGHKKHHKHSLYLIHNSELPGLSPTEMLIVANIARYHRKNIPRERHFHFMRLSEAQRDRTAKLAALLRVADALDRSHLQQVKEVSVKGNGNRVELHLKGGEDLLLEKWAMARKKDLFEQIFSRSVILAE